MKRLKYYIFAAACLFLAAYFILRNTDLGRCAVYALGGVREIAAERDQRFPGKVRPDSARCRGGSVAVHWQATPWVHWQKYWGAGDTSSRAADWTTHIGFLSADRRGIDGALLDLEYQRVELLKFNLFDNSDTYEAYIRGQNGTEGSALKTWPQMRLPKDHPFYAAVGADGRQKCQGELIRFRTLTGICNDIVNPLMGSSKQPFARNVQFEATFPEMGKNEIAKNRHGDRLALLKPDPQVISRRLLTRLQSSAGNCNDGQGLPGYAPQANCDYLKAPFFNVLAGFWIQFMTHDWFSHLEEGRYQSELMAMGCESQTVKHREQRLSPETINPLGCRPDDRIDRATVADESAPKPFTHHGKEFLSRAYKTTLNTVTAWWDASQIYGYDETSRLRVKRDPRDPAKLLLEPLADRAYEKMGYLPALGDSDPKNPQWAGQEAVAFPDNWTIGLSFFHNVFAREHNLFVDSFRRQAAALPQADSGLRHPDRPNVVITNKDVNADELFEVARLVVAAEIAKIHTIEWTTQLLYNEPLHLSMNANWNGLLEKQPGVAAALEKVVAALGKSQEARQNTELYSAFASGPGIFGLGNDKPDINGGVNHFGSPFNFPEEFVTVYRLHPLIPDLIDFREMDRDANTIRFKIPVVATLRGKATEMMRRHGLANWALSLGRQRVGKLSLQNHPLFLQNLSMPRIKSATEKIDVLALDIIRDRERGVPRFNEFRRQYGLKQLTGFGDFIDPELAVDSAERKRQQKLVALMREVYGRHRCDISKIITEAQLNDDGSKINDCLGHPHGSLVDNIEDLDTIVGWLAEPVRPHGFAISETQFQVFILNASRRLFSDRFFTSSFRPEFYTRAGVRWVNDNGPDGKVMEDKPDNGHRVEVSPLKRVLLRTIPELAAELQPVVNVFDPWARDRGAYYSLQWKPRPGAEADGAFKDP